MTSQKNGTNLGTGTKVVYDFVRQKVPMLKIDIYYKPYVDGLVDDLYDLITRDGLEFIKYHIHPVPFLNLCGHSIHSDGFRIVVYLF